MDHVTCDRERSSRFEALNSGLLSALGHLLLLIALGLMSGVSQIGSPGVELLAEIGDGESESADGIEILPLNSAAGAVDSTIAGGAWAAGPGGVGRSFVYVLDCSGSMNDEGRFVRARQELLRSIEHLTSDQSYFVIFY